jgi:hypothetical protein
MFIAKYRCKNDKCPNLTAVWLASDFRNKLMDVRLSVKCGICRQTMTFEGIATE